ncbi:hypothetical protein MKW92_043751 [Papaver armeniacum]|nr:hypothetical protein MKW92_043751 [Papaver armeniacum]
MAEISEHHVPEENNTKSERTGIQEDVPYLALDIGGSLIKLVYFSRHEQSPGEDEDNTNMMKALEHRSHPVHGGWLHFVKFETREINQCLDFIKFKQLHCQVGTDPENKQKGIAAKVKVTGAGAHKFADLFMEKNGVTVEKEDEMDCLAIGANFLLKVIQNEAFTFVEGKKESVATDKNDLFPYLCVNIGSGVVILKIEGDGNYETVDGTCIGGITCWGLGRLLTKCKSFNEIIESSKRGNIKRSKGTAKAMFLRHEGFVGALGALMSYENKHGLDIMDEPQDVETT